MTDIVIAVFDASAADAAVQDREVARISYGKVVGEQRIHNIRRRTPRHAVATTAQSSGQQLNEFLDDLGYCR